MIRHAPDPEESETVDSVSGVVSNTYRRRVRYSSRDRRFGTLDRALEQVHEASRRGDSTDRDRRADQ